MIATLLPALLALTPDLTAEKKRTPLSIHFDVTVERAVPEVWELWSTEAGVKRFFAPGVRIDGGVGDRYQVTFDPERDPEGRDHGTHGCRLLALEPGRRIAFEWTIPPLGAETNTRPFPTWVEVEFEPAPGAPGHTRVRFAHHGFGDSPTWRRAYELFRDVNWPVVLGRLVTYARDGVSPDWANPLGEPLRRVIRHDVVVDATPQEAWDAWTTEPGVVTFFAPAARVGHAAGEPYEIWFDPAAPAGARGGEGNRILALVPPRLFAFTWNAPPALPTVRGKRTVVNLHFEEAAPARTRVVLTSMGWGAGEDWARAHAYFEQAWPRVLAAFAARFTPAGRALVAGGAK